jgi:Domain of unknown function (DUF5047)
VIAVSQRFRRAIATGACTHTVTLTAQRGGITLGTLSATSGKVEMDARRRRERSMTLSLPDPDRAVFDLLSPFGTEIRVEAGVTYPDATTEMLAVGVFVVTDLARSRDEKTTAVTAEDRSWRISKAKRLTPWVVTPGAEVGAVQTAMLLDRWGDVSSDLPETDAIYSATTFQPGESSDPWEDACKLSDAFGRRLRMDGAGAARNAPLRSVLTDPPCVSYDPGTMAVTTLSERVSAESVCNGIVATASGPRMTAPVTYEVWDTDPGSPTCVDAIGYLPRFVTITDYPDADVALLKTMTDAAFRAETGRSAMTGWTQVPDPSLEPGDIVRIVVDGERSTHLIDAISLPLGAGLMTVTVRGGGWGMDVSEIATAIARSTRYTAPGTPTVAWAYGTVPLPDATAAVPVLHVDGAEVPLPIGQLGASTGAAQADATAALSNAATAQAAAEAAQADATAALAGVLPAAGGDGQVLTVVSGDPAWVDAIAAAYQTGVVSGGGTTVDIDGGGTVTPDWDDDGGWTPTDGDAVWVLTKP